MKTIHLRPASPADATFIAKGIYMAFLIDMNQFDAQEQTSRIDGLSAICAQEGVFYSYANTTIAEVDGVPAGMLIAYNGAHYAEQRIRTFDVLHELFTTVFGAGFEQMEDEAGAGEYYLDSIAVMPEYRGLGIGKRLLIGGIEQARTLGIPAVTLAVDPANPKAKGLYASLGFQDERRFVIFNDEYIKMRLMLTGE